MSKFRFSPRPNRAGEIAWRPWNEGSFREARQSNRPVLLSVSATWCTDSHAMDETTYSDDGVIHKINEGFIPIRVDGDHRPDIRARYNMDGRPTTIVLTPAGRVITGGSYLDTNEMLSLLQRVAKTCPETSLDTSGDHGLNDVRHNTSSKPTFPPTDGEILSGNIPSNLRETMEQTAQQINDSITEFYDGDFGGFASPPQHAPKDLGTQALDLLCTRTEKGRLDAGTRQMLEGTLDGMLEGDIFDSSTGGFFRCVAKRDWSSPHDAKTAWDNAEMVEIYLRASQSLGVSRWAEAARQILAYVDQHLGRDGGGFYGGQNTRRESDAASADTEPSFTDQTLYTDTNARLASVYFLAHRLLGDQAYLEAGRKTLQVIEDLCSDGDDLHHCYDGSAETVPGMLRDYTELALAYLDAHTAHGDPQYLDRALSLAEIIRERFALPDGCFTDKEQDAGVEVGLLQQPHVCLEQNARAALLCHKISLVRNDPSWEQQGVATLIVTAPEAERAGPRGAIWLASHLEISEPAPHIRILLCSKTRDGDLHRSVNFAPERHAVIEIDEGGVEEPLAYVCRQSYCFPPTSDPEELKTFLTPQRADISESRH